MATSDRTFMPSLAGPDYDRLFDRLEQFILQEVAYAEREVHAADGLLLQLDQRRPPGRRRAVRAEARFQSAALVQALLARAEDRRPDRRAEGFHWARLAYEAAAAGGRTSHGRHLGAAASLRRACLLEMAETLRLAGKLLWAARCLKVLAADPGFGCDPDEQARLCVALARVCRERGCGFRALGLYMQAVALFGEIKDFAAAAGIRREMRTLLGCFSVD